VQHSAILDVRVGSNPDGIHITPYNGVHPDAGMMPQHDIPNDLGRKIDITGGWNHWGYIVVRT
jgi:hypothetical protein